MSAAANRTKSRAEKNKESSKERRDEAAANTAQSRAEKNKESSKERRDEIAYYVAEAKQKDSALALTPAQASNLRIFRKYGKMEVEQGVRIATKFHKNVSKIRNADDMKQWLTDIIKAMPIAAKLLEEMNATPAPPAPTPAPPTDAAPPAPTPAPPTDNLKPLPSAEDPDVRASDLEGFDFDKGVNDDMVIDDTFFEPTEPTEPQLDYLDDFFDRADSADSDDDLEEYLDDRATAPNYFKLTL